MRARDNRAAAPRVATPRLGATAAWALLLVACSAGQLDGPRPGAPDAAALTADLLRLDDARRLDAQSNPDWAPDSHWGCASDADCTAAGRPRCAPDGACVECLDDVDCGAPGTRCEARHCITECGFGPKPTPGSTVWPVPAMKSTCALAFGAYASYMPPCMFHTGIDICMYSEGADIVAMADGKVVHVGYMWYNVAGKGRGPHAVIIQHAPGFFSTYSHNRMAAVKVGDCVTAGQKIAELGNLGYSNSPHLHFEVLDGTSYTGEELTPFTDPCVPNTPSQSAYKDPLDYVSPN